ncbi:MAG: recombinase RecT [Mogibacterium sp.]|nr:recombinase RecT [Mogibacterium sp.]
MAVNNSLVKSKGQQRLGLTAYLTQDAVKNNINQVVGGKDGQKFIASVVSAVQANPQLQECTNSSILSAALLGSSLNLTPSPQLGQFYFVPFKNTKAGVVEAQFQLGYKGYIQLAIRSGYYKKLNVLPIKEGELIRFDPLDEEIEVQLIDDEDAREKAPTIGYYATFIYTNGFKKAIYWSRAKMQSHAEKYSQGYQRDLKNGTSFTFWSKNFDDMACKTMLRHLISRWGIMSTELQTAFENDMAVIHEDGTKTFVDTEEAPALEAPEPAPADPNSTVQRAEEIINRAEEKIEAEKKQKKAATKKAAPADPSAALFE